MRITNNMTTNKMLLNINRNAVAVDRYYNQLTTGKKILTASDDPIIASRALKFRTNISQTMQYQRNVAQGLSWMEISEYGFTNTTNALEIIRTLCDQAANDTLEVVDRQKIAAEIQLTFDQICSEMNINYAGRYVFSGYRTDEPATLTQDSKASFDINQIFQTGDMEKTLAFVKTETGAPPLDFMVNRIKLPYNLVENLDIQLRTGKDADDNWIYQSMTVVTKSSSDPDAYDPQDAAGPPATGVAHYIKETGEIIFSPTATQDYLKATNGIEVNYTKTGFSKGELNPKVYFTCTQTKDNNGNYIVSDSNFTNRLKLPNRNISEISPASITLTDIAGNSASYDIVLVNKNDPNAYSPADDQIFCIKETGELVFGADAALAYSEDVNGMAIDYKTADVQSFVNSLNQPLEAGNIIQLPNIDITSVNSITIKNGNGDDVVYPITLQNYPSPAAVDNEIFLEVETGKLIFGDFAADAYTASLNGIVIAVPTQTEKITTDRFVPSAASNELTADNKLHLSVNANIKGVNNIILKDSVMGANKSYKVIMKSETDPDWETPGPDEIYCAAESGILVFGTNAAADYASTQNVPIKYVSIVTGSKDVTLSHNVRINYNATITKNYSRELVQYAPKEFNMENQELQFEFGQNTLITINNLSKDILTATLFADLKALCETVGSIKISTDAEIRAYLLAQDPTLANDEARLEEEVKLQVTEETQKYRGILNDRFNNMLKLIDTHSSQVSTQNTNLGSRMNRLDLIQSRLEQDRVSYTKLMSDNENVDYLEVAMRLNSAESVYQAALKTGSSIIQLSLVDFI